MTITLNGTTGITTPAVTNDGAYTGDGVSFADATPINTLVTDTSGNVGIGTSSPAQKLDVSGSGITRIAVRDSSSTGVGLFKANGADVYLDNSSATGNLIFQNTNGTERMRIDSSGNFMSGTTISGLSALQGFNITQAGGSTYATVGHVSGTSAGQPWIAFSYNGSAIGSITQSGTTATSYNTSSDYRLKENIAPMTGALATVAQLKPVTYTWKADGSEGQGFIAHELQAVVPDCVTGEKDAVDADGKPVYQGIDTSFLVATLTAAIQEQQAIISDLKARIETLENK